MDNKNGIQKGYASYLFEKQYGEMGILWVLDEFYDYLPIFALLCMNRAGNLMRMLIDEKSNDGCVNNFYDCPSVVTPSAGAGLCSTNR